MASGLKGRNKCIHHIFTKWDFLSFVSWISVLQVWLGHGISLNQLAWDLMGNQQEHMVRLTKSKQFLNCNFALWVWLNISPWFAIIGGQEAPYAPQTPGFGAEAKSGKYGTEDSFMYLFLQFNCSVFLHFEGKKWLNVKMPTPTDKQGAYQPQPLESAAEGKSALEYILQWLNHSGQKCTIQIGIYSSAFIICSWFNLRAPSSGVRFSWKTLWCVT